MNTVAGNGGPEQSQALGLKPVGMLCDPGDFGRVNEDRIGSTDRAAWVIDGASAPATETIDGLPPPAWLAHRLTMSLTRSASNAHSVSELLRIGITDAARRFYSQPITGHVPSAAIGIALLCGNNMIQTASLGDVTIAALDAGGAVKWLHSSRRSKLESQLGGDLSARLRSGVAYDEARHSLLEGLERHRSQFMNKPGGYWIASVDPRAAEHAALKTFEVQVGNRILLASDGFMAADRYGLVEDWRELLANPDMLTLTLKRIREIEESDQLMSRFPRAKRSDDASALLLSVV